MFLENLFVNKYGNFKVSKSYLLVKITKNKNINYFSKTLDILAKMY